MNSFYIEEKHSLLLRRRRHDLRVYPNIETILRREHVSSLEKGSKPLPCKGGRVPIIEACNEERVSPLYIEKVSPFPRKGGGGVSPLQRGGKPCLCEGEIVSLPYREESGRFSVKGGRVSFLYREEATSSSYRGEGASPL